MNTNSNIKLPKTIKCQYTENDAFIYKLRIVGILPNLSIVDATHRNSVPLFKIFYIDDNEFGTLLTDGESIWGIKNRKICEIKDPLINKTSIQNAIELYAKWCL